MFPGRASPKIAISSTQRAVRVPRKRLHRLITFLARHERVPIASVDMAIVPDEQIASLHRRWLGCAATTDVLSFDLSDDTERGLSAQLIISGDQAARAGPAHGEPVERELMRYVIHGLLHLMGHEDSTVRGAAKMHAREDQLLDEFARRERRRRGRRKRNLTPRRRGRRRR